MEKLECTNCESKNTVVVDYFPDGEDFIDVEVACKDCNLVSWHTISKEELDKYGIEG